MEFSVPYTLETPRGTLTFNDTASGSYYWLNGIDGMDGAAVRTNVDVKPQRDGAILHNSYLGARTIVLTGQVVAGSFETRRTMLDDLAAHVVSILRANGTLRFTPTGGSARQLTVRAFDKAVVRGGVVKEFQLTLLAPDPFVYSDTLFSASTSPLTGGGTAGGVALPHAFPFSFGEYTAGGEVTVTNSGNVNSYPVVRVYGPITAPTLRNLTTGSVLSFPGLSVSAGSYAALDMAAETARLDDLASSPLIRYLDVASSEFWPLIPGSNIVRLTGSSFSSATNATVLYRHAFA